MAVQRQFSLIIIEKAWLILSGLLTLKMLSSSLSVAHFGVYQSAVAMLVIATAITWICPVEAIASRLDSSGNLSAHLFQTVLILRFGISACVFLIIAVFSLLAYGDEYQSYVLILLVCVSILHVEPAGLMKFQIEAKGKLAALSLGRIINNILRLLIMAFFAKKNASAIFVIMLIAVEQLANTMMYWGIFARINQSLTLRLPSFDKQVAIDVLRAGAKYWVGFVFMYCQLKFDRVYLAHTMSPDDFGVYSAGANMAEQVNSLGLTLVSVLAPAYIYAKSRSEAMSNTKAFALKLFGAGLILAVIGYLAAPIAFSIIFGSKYEAALEIFKILVLLSPLAFLDAALSVLIFKFDYRVFFIAKTMFAFAITATIITVGAPFYGWMAALVASTAGLISNMVFNCFALKKMSGEHKC